MKGMTSWKILAFMYSIITLFRGLIQGLLVFLNRILGQNTASLVEFGHDDNPIGTQQYWLK